ncbi:MAG: hypothetical protein RLZZ501_1616 [Pseudomonadota bacterium]|jgi:pimeloyl-ACP methyl ester carboxylesterase
MIARVERDGVCVAYRVEGAGPGLVLVHGTGADGESNWAPMAAELARDWTVVRPDYAGSGQTRDGGGPLTVTDLAAQVVMAAEAAGLARFDLVGFSLGAAVAATIAADRPERVRRLGLLGPLLSASDPRLQLEFRLWRDLIDRDRATLARLIVLTGFSPAFVSQLGAAGLDALIGLIHDGNDWAGMARQVELDLILDVAAAARQIACPTLVVGQRLDHMVPVEQARAVAAAIPGARYAEIDTGHLGLLERPGEVVGLLRGFLRDGT